MQEMLVQSWEAVARSLVMLVCAYAALLTLLRVSGKRTLSKLNAFDFAVTVALGSILATICLSKDVSLAQGAFVLVCLVALQFLVGWISARSNQFERIVKNKPTILLANGAFDERALKRQRLTRDDILAAMRSRGIGAIEEVCVVVFETDGSFSIIKTSEASSGSTYRSLEEARQS